VLRQTSVQAGRQGEISGSAVASLRAVSTPPPFQDLTPENANSLRGSEFRRLMAKRTSWAAVVIPALVVGGLAARNGAVVGLGIAIFIALVGLGVILWIADRNAGNRFWQTYAETRGLELGGRTRLPEATPFLRQGQDRYATRTLSGQIVPGIVGTVGLFTYEETTVGADGNTETKYYNFTFAMAEVPECAAHLPELYVKRKSGLRSLEKLEDVFRRGKRRVTLESDALGKRYEIFVGKGQDEVWTRRLFSPTFIVWLTEAPPAKYGFDLVDGTLVAYIPDHKEDAATLDAMAAATGSIAQRLLEESAETSASGAASSAPGQAR
jgi:hypothetical protein